MSRRYNIKWTDADNKELRRVVKNFNAKISRLEKKNPQHATKYPERVTVKELKELIETRQDFKREVNTLKRFSNKGAEQIIDVPDNKYNLKATKWQIQEMNRRLPKINKLREERLEMVKNLDMTSRGKKLGYKVGELGMGGVDENSLKPIKAFTPSMNRPDFNKRFKTLKKEHMSKFWDNKDKQMKENYLSGLLRNYNDVRYADKVEAIQQAIEKMDFKEFYKIFKAEDGTFEIVSPQPGQPTDKIIEANINALLSTWVPNYKPKKKSNSRSKRK